VIDPETRNAPFLHEAERQLMSRPEDFGFFDPDRHQVVDVEEAPVFTSSVATRQ